MFAGRHGVRTSGAHASRARKRTLPHPASSRWPTLVRLSPLQRSADAPIAASGGRQRQILRIGFSGGTGSCAVGARTSVLGLFVSELLYCHARRYQSRKGNVVNMCTKRRGSSCDGLQLPKLAPLTSSWNRQPLGGIWQDDCSRICCPTEIFLCVVGAWYYCKYSLIKTMHLQ